MEQYLLPLMFLLPIAVLFFMGSNARKKQAEMQAKLNDELKQGVWARTGSGFYGIVVDIDGDVVVLASPDGTETLWDRRAIVEVTEPPFSEEDETEEETENPQSEAEETK
ncbi:preprotein translocase subunit YajC [Gleimia sp. 6138-11-ORH1]|uniref:preprotein translocase subunit YajC n=1 Tax=Gleimia sp. 6138-11-ORH1 TaxID=2973937 RepID=UPI0021693E31|nr:preprotein translocase subunit YajC [Gleimia sp. 6138-11-ORH1]MCS4484411.1 preprotein translocase subunit YajC [Gleimia sp. 6138-11-ORH1]